MTVVRLLQNLHLPDHAGRLVPKQKGDLHKVDNRRVLRMLVAQNKVQLVDPLAKETHCYDQKDGKMLPSPTCQKRIGVFAYTSAHYSGGRIHLWQIAYTLAEMGHDVWFITNTIPKWMSDYPISTNLHLVTDKYTAIPGDLDFAFTDGKNMYGRAALSYKLTHPRTKMCMLNFETAHWVAKYDKVSAAKMEDTVPMLREAEWLFANSKDSCQDVREVLGTNTKVEAIPPVVNTYAIERAPDTLPVEVSKHGDTPFVVWVARGSAYKGIQDAVAAVKAYPGKLNLVALGAPGAVYKNDDDKHKFISFAAPVTDAVKMAIIKQAVAVIAPSKFEGYGMVPGEALCCGTPVVVYDLPVLRDNYGDFLIYAKWGDTKNFAAKVAAAIKNPPKVDVKKAQEKYGLAAMRTRLDNIPIFTTKKRVSAQLICYYGPSVTEAIASVYPHVDEILIAYGPIAIWSGGSPGDALQQIKAFPDPKKKIKLEERRKWKDKTEMRQWCTDNATGNRMLIFDADEIYHNLDKWIEADPVAGCPRWVHFWHDEDHYVADRAGDARWGRYEEGKIGVIHPHYRWSHWRPVYYFQGSKGVRAEDLAKVSLNNRKMTDEADAKCPECVIYHLGHTLSPELMKQKHEFYLKRDGKDIGRVQRKEAWHKWKGGLGDQGDGLIRKVTWELPPLVKQAFERMDK